MPPVFRHEDSLRGVIDFNRRPLPHAMSAKAKKAFNDFIQCYENNQESLQARLEPQNRTTYRKITLIKETYGHCQDQDAFLRHFFSSLDFMNRQDDKADFERGLKIVEEFLTKEPTDDAVKLLFDYADDLLIFYFKMKTRPAGDAIKTPSHLTADPTPVNARRRLLRELCLKRDRNRCVATGLFNRPVASERYLTAIESDGQLLDDDGKIMDYKQRGNFEHLEVAHIIPISLIMCDMGKDLTRAQKLAFAVLDMFDSNITATIDGCEIDTPKNAISLSIELHKSFGNYLFCFEEAKTYHASGEASTKPHAYQIHSYNQKLPLLHEFTSEVNFNNPCHIDIDPPSSRLLRIHRAIGDILKLSGAGEYIDQVLRDAEEPTAENGSTNLGAALNWKLADQGGHGCWAYSMEV